ncbi:MAG: DeoR/GlpR family DNA-binding transcription regulator [Succinivibrionaceae bacterium]|nr:DeoR/GlpR family DNA-binding transcription regulator [Succinivibrionaceae bacterium]
MQNQRHQAIIDYLRSHTLATVDDLSAHTSASPSTIRRDLIRLDQQGLVDRVHGGVSLRAFGSAQPTTSEKALRNQAQKRAIGAAAAELVANNQAVMIDAGTTTLELARAIASLRLKVITSDLNIGLLLSPHRDIELSITGGAVDWSSQSCIGQEALEFMARIHPSITFISCNAFNLEVGISAPTFEKSAFKRTLLTQSGSRKILLADSSKFGKSQLFEVGPLAGLDMIITDRGLSDQDAASIEALGVEVRRC